MQKRKKAFRVGIVLSNSFVRNIRVVSGVKDRLNGFYQKAKEFAKRKPFTSFLVVLALLFVAIAANAFTAPKPQEVVKEEVAKEVEVYRIGKAAKTNILAQVEKTGVITIVAQTPGIVSAVNVNEGDTVGRGKTLVSLANNYGGGNAASISRQLAGVQYQNTKDTHDFQKNLIGKQRELAEKSDANADEIRGITDKSLSETRSVIDLNNSILSTIDSNLTQYEATNSAGTNDQLIFSSKQLKSQLTSGNNQLRAGLRAAEYQAAGDKPAASLSDLQKDIAIGQLDLQTKALDLSLEVGRLQLALAQIMEASMYPAAPFGGAIERVHVHVGQNVNPGAPLVTLSGNKQEVSAVAKVPVYLARNISMLEESVIHIGGKSYETKPDFVSAEATDGQLYSVIFTIPPEYFSAATDGEYIRIEIPVGFAATGASVPFIPIDSVFQTQDAAYVYVVEGQNAASRNISLGQVIGANVEVAQGLTQYDLVIINRNVLAGDRISISN